MIHVSVDYHRHYSPSDMNGKGFLGNFVHETFYWKEESLTIAGLFCTGVGWYMIKRLPKNARELPCIGVMVGDVLRCRGPVVEDFFEVCAIVCDFCVGWRNFLKLERCLNIFLI